MSEEDPARECPLVEDVRVESSLELLRWFDPLDERWREPGGWIFRGHADEAWKLVPRIFRNGLWQVWLDVAPRDLMHTEEYFRAWAEWTVVADFVGRANAAGLEVPLDMASLEIYRPVPMVKLLDFPSDQIVPLLALARHYGLPTRLLDWTRRARFAVYFAAATAASWCVACRDSTRLAIWALRAGTSNHRGFQVVSAPRFTNARMHAQDGMFTLQRSFEWSFDVEKALDSDPRTVRPGFRRATAPARLAPELLRLLSYEGVTAASMLPGLDGVAEAFWEEHLWDRPAGNPDRLPDRGPCPRCHAAR